MTLDGPLTHYHGVKLAPPPLYPQNRAAAIRCCQMDSYNKHQLLRSNASSTDKSTDHRGLQIHSRRELSNLKVYDLI